MTRANDRKYIINQWLQWGFFMAIALACLVGLRHGSMEDNEVNFEAFLKALIPSLILCPLGGYFLGRQQWESIIRKRKYHEAQALLLKTHLKEDKIIKFKLAKSSMNFYKNYHSCAVLVLGASFIFFTIFALMHNSSLINAILFPSIFCVTAYVIVLVGVYRVRRAIMAYELTFNDEKKEFGALIMNREEVIRFMVKDIKEVGKEPTQGGFRFYLKDGTWVTWNSASTNREGDLENLIRSLGIDVRIVSFW